MKKILIIALLQWPLLTFAQYDIGGGGAFSLGYYAIDNSPLAGLSSTGTRVSNGAMTFGGNGYFQFDRLVLGAKGYGMVIPDVEDDMYLYSAGGGSFMVELGFKIWHKDSYSVYPFWGAGFVGYRVTQSVKGDLDLTTDPNLELNNRSYGWSSVAFDVGFRYEQQLNTKEFCGQKGGMYLAIEAGYQYTPETRDWETSGGGDIKGAPDFSMGSFFTKVSIGGFGGE